VFGDLVKHALPSSLRLGGRRRARRAQPVAPRTSVAWHDAVDQRWWSPTWC